MTAELGRLIDMVDRVYKAFGLPYEAKLSTRNPEKFIGDVAVWDEAERTLEAAVKEKGLAFRVEANEGAFYGPKIDFDVTDAIGRKWQCATIQLDFVAPELREGLGEVATSAAHGLPELIRTGDIHGVLHCHSHFSDGEASIADLAQAARARGWAYLGVSDHSQSAFYAGGLDRESIVRQHAEIDAVNATFTDFRVLKGVEADILPCGRVDYDEATLDSFDYVIASVHSRFGMNEQQMTDRVLKAMDDPHVTIIGHPTGRLLLTREPFAINLDAVLEKAGAVGVAMELNADPHRLDLDWRYLRSAKTHGAKIEIGPDAHAVAGLDNIELGVAMARKGWLAAGDVLNALPLDQFRDVVRTRRAMPRRTAASVSADANGR